MSSNLAATAPYISPLEYPVAPDWEMTLRIVAGRGIFERRSFNNFMKQVEGRDIAIDVGAHVGSWSIAMSRMFQTVVCFEPHPVNRDYLNANLQRAGATNVIVHHQALVDKSCLRSAFTISAHGTTRNSGMPYLSRASEATEGGTPVTCTTLDKFADNFALAGRRISAIKVDVEGMELPVMMGGRALIEEFKPPIMVEIKDHCERYGIKREQLFDFMSEMRYRVKSRSRSDYVFTH